MSKIQDAELVRETIKQVCDDLAELLIAKNISYNNALFNPINLFNKASIRDTIGTYIDSKITRIAAGLEYGDESSMQDLAGYIALLLVLDRLDPIDKSIVKEV